MASIYCTAIVVMAEFGEGFVSREIEECAAL
jgi:hypothetical protein